MDARKAQTGESSSGEEVGGGAPGDGPQPARGVRVAVTDRTGRLGPAGAAWLGERAAAAAEHLGATGEVRVAVVDDREMAVAHERHLGQRGTTDVITFDLGGRQGPLDADLLVCVDEAERQAVPRGIEPSRELLLYVVHGILHCLGYDDRDEPSHRRIHAREDEVLDAIGVGATFGLAPREERAGA